MRADTRPATKGSATPRPTDADISGGGGGPAAGRLGDKGGQSGPRGEGRRRQRRRERAAHLCTTKAQGRQRRFIYPCDFWRAICVFAAHLGDRFGWGGGQDEQDDDTILFAICYIASVGTIQLVKSEAQGPEGGTPSTKKSKSVAQMGYGGNRDNCTYRAGGNIAKVALQFFGYLAKPTL